jgi:hypothetical protein
MKVRAVAAAAMAAFTFATWLSGSAVARSHQSPTRAVCSFEFAWTLSEGTSMTPTSGMFTSTSGTFSCRGTVFGRTASGRPGRLTASETYGPDTCLSGQGQGPFKAIVKTTRGPIRVRGVFDERRVGATGVTTGSLAARHRGRAHFHGTYSLVPTAGQDCFTHPVTSGTVQATVALAG